MAGTMLYPGSDAFPICEPPHVILSNPFDKKGRIVQKHSLKLSLFFAHMSFLCCKISDELFPVVNFLTAVRKYVSTAYRVRVGYIYISPCSSRIAFFSASLCLPFLTLCFGCLLFHGIDTKK
jgi:hypothetical protein